MKHTWRCDFEDGDYSEYCTQKTTIDDLLDEFRMYLQGCGFVFNSTDEIVRVDTEEEVETDINYVYVVTMHSLGNSENYSYVIGVFSTFEQAQDAAQLEDEYRVGKYEWYIERRQVDKLFRDYEEEM